MRRRLTLLAILLCHTQTAFAISCSITGSPVVNFGNIDPFSATSTDITQTLSWTCNKPVLDALSATLCIYATRGNASTTGSVTPREMAHSSGSPTINYNLYRNAARTQVIGQAGETVNQGIAVPVNFSLLGCVIILACSTSGTATLYGRLTAPVNAASKAGNYVSSMANSRVSVISGTLTGNCDNQNLAASSTYVLQAQATVLDQCRVSATDMAFGPHGLLLAPVDAQSTVSVRCSNETDFSVSLDNGLNAAGSQRRMVSAGSNLLPYEIYRDGARTQRWGSAPGETVTGVGLGTATVLDLPVYGRVPANTLAAPGDYTDTLTVEVTF
ncbi:hypothetical protein A167_01017 [Alcanivorax sp. S71-1-4]|uniref:Csu type fimbrial protein n=1 Tax=Alcanivorax sp. S71-1-4 TaxID=1177159 RepID=UPI0013581ADB|nr:spore coat U domain-containing protein [Alcanivorax sp. S71-1-4]KAF0810336.1 hypothetical protein A167_01017 [Alcanivorax sp. S71-1-4]